MMKQLRGVIIGFVVLGLVVGGYFAAVSYKNSQNKSNGSTTPSGSASVSLLSTSDEKINEVYLINANGTFQVQKDKKKNVMKKPTSVKTTQDKVDSFVTSFNSIDADKVIIKDAKEKDLTDYGLTEPTAMLAVTTSDKKIHKFFLGDQTYSGDGYYLTTDKKTIYLISTYTAENFLKKQNDLADVKILNFVAADVKNIALDRDSKNIFTAEASAGNEWIVTKPVKVRANSEVMTKIMEVMPGLEMKEFVAGNVTDMKKYGLDKPYYVFSFESKKQNAKLLIGGQVNAGSSDMYATVAGTKTVFILDTSTLTFLDKNLTECIDRLIYLPNIKDIYRMDVDMKGIKLKCDVDYKDDAKQEDSFKVDGRNANLKDNDDKNLFKNFYQGVIGPYLEDFDYSGKPTGKADYTYKFYFKKTNKIVTVEYIPKNSSYYYAIIDGEYTKALINKKFFESVDGPIAKYKILKAAMDAADKK